MKTYPGGLKIAVLAQKLGNKVQATLNSVPKVTSAFTVYGPTNTLNYSASI